MKIVITAGGTSESIDRVRKITNSSSGKLGSIIAETLLKRDDISEIFYICTKKSIKPPVGVYITNGKKDLLHIIEIENTMDLKETVEKILTTEKIDYFIHSMAVSDYMVDYVSTAELLSKEIKDSDDIEKTIKNAKNKLNKNSKISSSEDNLVVVLKQTPKVISLIKKISPETKLIGFKLLENVSKENLLEVAKDLMNKNDCDYVIANDLRDITATKHKAYLIDKEVNIIVAETKNEIAKIISQKIS